MHSLSTEVSNPFVLMPISTREYLELRLASSDYIQRASWDRLLELCGTTDDETSRTIAAIFSFYSPEKVWKFVEYAASLPPDQRKEKRDSMATIAYIIGKIGHSDLKKSLAVLKTLLSDDHMLRAPVSAALSNMWVLETTQTARDLFHNWIMEGEDNNDLQEVGVKSAEYLASQAPSSVAAVLKKVDSLGGERKPASRAAQELIAKYLKEGGRKNSSREANLQKKKDKRR